MHLLHGRTSSSPDAALPHDTDAERSLLASLLLDVRQVDVVAALVEPADFFAPAHRTLYRIVRDVYGETGTTDETIIASRWKQEPDAEALGSTAFIFDLLQLVPSAINAPVFARQIRECSLRRRAIEIGREIVAKADRGESLVEIASTLDYEGAGFATAIEGPGGRPRPRPMTAAELDGGDFRVEYYIRDILPKGEPGIIAAKSKSLKTHHAFALCFALATGTPYLGHFPTFGRKRTALLSAESGAAALQESGRRIARSQGLSLSDADMLIDTRVPRLPADARSIERFITNEGLSLLCIDPAYFLLRDIGDNLANATLVGAALEPLSEIAHNTGCSVVVVAHNTKGRRADQKRYDPPLLEEVAGAGIDQWTRFWLLLGPRQEWDSDVGQHWQWLRSGGSAGHGNLYAVDVFEGRQSDQGGRVWEPTVSTATDANREREAEKGRKAAEQQQRKIDANVGKLRAALHKFTAGETERVLRTRAGLNAASFAEALSVLEGRGEVVTCRIQKGKQTFDGYRRNDPWGLGETVGQSETNGHFGATVSGSCEVG